MNLFVSPTIPPPEQVAGVDEAGRGCLAGPVVAAAVILPADYDLPGLTDSKQLTLAGRQRLEPLIRDQAVAWSLGLSWPREIESINILRASLVAMRRAVCTLRTVPAYVLVDGNQKIPFSLPQESVIGGDAKVPCISAASVLAKTFRDRLMVHLDRRYPGYGFAEHKGYGTRAHQALLAGKGPCPMHRTTFRGVAPRSCSKEKALCLPGLEK
ncbi:ribonuclease HII [Desulfoplanes formicivorans]|uniref:Ribonuclease HII n=1 Tax=Desulfoplanes formicivorans TaxID=1592317 RepID=A0A194AL45_9BACT|nr:ribonuclease HII [Desulfoplanes formicivorans]GAU09965.1 ribonuclease HII [Desulfoplanes formicivorans]